jgi:hypothetical protein
MLLSPIVIVFTETLVDFTNVFLLVEHNTMLV